MWSLVQRTTKHKLKVCGWILSVRPEVESLVPCVRPEQNSDSSCIFSCLVHVGVQYNAACEQPGAPSLHQQHHLAQEPLRLTVPCSPRPGDTSVRSNHQAKQLPSALPFCATPCLILQRRRSPHELEQSYDVGGTGGGSRKHQHRPEKSEPQPAATEACGGRKQ